MPEKIYLYVDETGQDTGGRLFIVGIVTTGQDNDTYRATCEAIEALTGKESKWTKTAYPKRIDYIGRVLHEPLFSGRLFFAIYQNTRRYTETTTETIGRVLISLGAESARAMVFIDALPKPLAREVILGLRRSGVHVDKVRGVAKDENEALIRLADALCGLVRAAFENQEDMQELLDWGIRTGVIRDLS